MARCSLRFCKCWGRGTDDKRRVERGSALSLIHILANLLENLKCFLQFFIPYRGKHCGIIRMKTVHGDLEKYFSLDKKWICNIIKKIDVYKRQFHS